MDDDQIKAKLAEQIVNGTEHEVRLAREKIKTLNEAGLVEFQFKSPDAILPPRD
jgi:hypothetical protein